MKKIWGNYRDDHKKIIKMLFDGYDVVNHAVDITVGH